jgi:hypothetical protein
VAASIDKNPVAASDFGNYGIGQLGVPSLEAGLWLRLLLRFANALFQGAHREIGLLLVNQQRG